LKDKEFIFRVLSKNFFSIKVNVLSKTEH